MNRKKFYSIEGLPERLELLISDNNTSCVDLARAIGCDRKAIYSWLSGYTTPNSYYLARICKYYKVSSDWLLYGEKIK